MDKIYDIINKAVDAIRGLKEHWLLVCIIAGTVVIILITLYLLVRIIKKSKQKKSNKTEKETKDENASVSGEIDLKPADLQVKDEETKVSQKADEQKLDINYDSIIRKIIRKRKKYKCILFASADTESLPVTIPANVAVGLVKNKKLCLLIDLDVARDAIAEAFGIESEANKVHQKAVRTKFENLWVLPGRNFVRHKQMNIKSIVQNALDRFDLVLINAPNLVVSADRNQIISAANTAVICSKDMQDEPLKKMLKTAKCKVFQHIRTGQ